MTMSAALWWLGGPAASYLLVGIAALGLFEEGSVHKLCVSVSVMDSMANLCGCAYCIGKGCSVRAWMHGQAGRPVLHGRHSKLLYTTYSCAFTLTCRGTYTRRSELAAA